MSSPAALVEKQKRKSLKLKAEELKDEARFLRSWIEKPLLIGAVSPSGKPLARAIARTIDPDRPGPVLELGPGTGPVTEAILERGVAPERLILIEFNPSFVQLLRERFPGVTVIQGSAYEVRSLLEGRLTEPLAAVVSGLPLLTKPLPMRAALLRDCLELAAPGAPFAQFTYATAPPIPQMAVEGISAKGSSIIWRNIPPARVWAYRRH